MIYEYGCNACEHIFDVSCKMIDMDLPRTCPECGSGDTKRRLTFPGAMIPADRLGRTKTPDGFKDVLKTIKEKALGGKYMNSNSI